MIEPNLRLQKPLEDYVEYIEKLSLRSIPLLESMSDPSFSLQDPYHDIVGRIEVQRLLEHRLKTYPDANYRVRDFMWGRKEAVAYIYWSFHYLPKKNMPKRKPASLIMEGMSELKFLPDGRIYSCREFWGAHAHFGIKSYKKFSITK